jgi:hypothetical protein
LLELQDKHACLGLLGGEYGWGSSGFGRVWG